jgi:hypothetical protein
MNTKTKPRPPSEAIKLVEQEEAEEKAMTEMQKIWAMLDARKFDFNNPPPPTEPIYTIREMPVATAGNISVVQAKVKAGKTAVLGAMIAAAINPEADERMTLGIRSTGASGRAVIHFDCEQSPDDHYAVICNALRRAGLAKAPAMLRSYCLTDVPAKTRMEMLRAELRRAGEVFVVFLDGVADLTFRVNDEEDANALVEELRALSIEHDCGMVVVLHENPGSEIGKTRGHLGSQLERKQYGVLRIAKDANGVSTLWTERSRKAEIPKAQGLRFAYDPEAEMHLPVDSSNDVQAAAAKDELVAFAACVFERASKDGLKWTELKNKIMDDGKYAKQTAEKKIRAMTEAGIIQRNLLHRYVLNV